MPGVTRRNPFSLGGNNFTIACGDIDDDGDMDFMSATIVHGDVGGSSDPCGAHHQPGRRHEVHCDLATRPPVSIDRRAASTGTTATTSSRSWISISTGAKTSSERHRRVRSKRRRRRQPRLRVAPKIGRHVRRHHDVERHPLADEVPAPLERHVHRHRRRRRSRSRSRATRTRSRSTSTEMIRDKSRTGRAFASSAAAQARRTRRASARSSR